MSMIGLVATVIKTDITETIYSRSIDILLHSVNLLSERDHYTAGHSSRVHHYCRMIVESLGLHNEKRFKRDLYFAALLHDIGKIGIRDDILLKETRLTKKEFSMLESHPEKGYNALKHYRFLDKSTIYILNHHERPD
jgi:HD-GYP domain-containing protein (c-di-GMP phosphodiesterase class II)